MCWFFAELFQLRATRFNGRSLHLRYRLRTSVAAFVAIRHLSLSTCLDSAGDSWQTCALQPRCIIEDSDGRRVLVLACQDYAARVWPVCQTEDIMMLDPDTLLEWIVATSIDDWAVVPWLPDIAVNRDASQARYGCVTFRQSGPTVPALAWAVAHHHLHETHLQQFVDDRNVACAEGLLESVLPNPADLAFYMNIFRSDKTPGFCPSCGRHDEGQPCQA